MADMRRGLRTKGPEDGLAAIADGSHLHTNRRQTGVESRREGRFMTCEELRTNQEHMWQALSGEQSMTLALAMEMLLRCHLSPYQILNKTMTALGGLQHDS
jgi:hypothetical protein